MAQTVALSATAREKTGKGAARQARFQKKIPAVIYGHGRATQTLMVDALALEKALTGIEPASTLIELSVDGKTTRTLIREIQRHPLRPDIIHVDFYEIKSGEKLALKIGDSLHVRDLSIPNAAILTGADLTIATVVPPRAEEVAAPTAEATTEVAEPELIRKVREGEEGEEVEGAAGAPEAKAAPKAEEKPKGKKEE